MAAATAASARLLCPLALPGFCCITVQAASIDDADFVNIFHRLAGCGKDGGQGFKHRFAQKQRCLASLRILVASLSEA
jgi:predicted DNA-binding helix-hairpin-helix protein